MNRREFIRGLGGAGLAAIVGGSQIVPRATHTVNVVLRAKLHRPIVPPNTLIKMKDLQRVELKSKLWTVK